MQTVILNGARGGDLKVDEVTDVLASKLQSLGHVDVFKLREIKIAECLGCFGCWVKTPGECVINDREREITKKLLYADLKIYVTPIVFGGYSYELKKALDRQTGNILPFFTKFKGEIHHPLRLERSSNFIAVGVLPKPSVESETIFKTLVSRNAINMHAHAYSTAIIYLTDESKEINQKIEGTFIEVGLKNGVT
jgi:multimeric flavodoxin WrbA